MKTSKEIEKYDPSCFAKIDNNTRSTRGQFARMNAYNGHNNQSSFGPYIVIDIGSIVCNYNVTLTIYLSKTFAYSIRRSCY